jgi:hypothetical protein
MVAEVLRHKVTWVYAAIVTYPTLNLDTRIIREFKSVHITTTCG